MNTSHMGERQLQKAYDQGKITREQFVAGLQRIGTARHAKDMRGRLRTSMSSSKWVRITPKPRKLK